MSVKKLLCEFCGQEISASNYSKHVRRHENHPETFETPKYKLDHDGLNCQFCGKRCKNKNSLCNHERLCKQNPNKQELPHVAEPIEGFNNFGRAAWNKGLTKETNDIIRQYSDHMKALVKQNGHIGCVGLKGAESTSANILVREKISKTMSLLYAYPRGWAKRGWYRGIWCDSSWELAFVLYCFDNNINFIRNKDSFPYTWDGYTHNYTPDFYLPDQDMYIEIKGQYTEKEQAKIEQFSKSITVYQYTEMLPILDYVTSKYGDNFTDLYEAI